jgi:ectoine hydroxylase-related dioxygenase (phytanoyl-CoA dioxygenase family)
MHGGLVCVAVCMFGGAHTARGRRQGGTLLVPKSHRWRRERAAEQPELALRCEMPRGSVPCNA